MLTSADPTPRNLTDKILILGNPAIEAPLPKLSFAADEAKTIAKLYRAKALLDREATEIVVGSKGEESKIVHLAAHGEYNDRNPLFSTIYLAKDEQNKIRWSARSSRSLWAEFRKNEPYCSQCLRDEYWRLE